MDSHSAGLVLSAVTIAEVADGIAKGRREGAKRKAAHLCTWRGFAHIVIAATARPHRLVILSRNRRPIAAMGAAVIDPLGALRLRFPRPGTSAVLERWTA